jgi:phosphoglycerate dehydrogenase-like enzyme
MPPRCIIRAAIGADAVLAEARRHLGEEAVAAHSVVEVAQGLEAGAEFLIVSDAIWSAEMSAAVMASGRRLRWIQSLTTGIDRMQRFGLPQGVSVSNVGAAFAPAVATHAVALLLALQRRLPGALAAQARCQWERSIGADSAVPLGQRGVVLGFGPIGQEICRLLQAFGMRMTAVSRSGTACDWVEVLPATRLDEVLAEADALVLAAPLTAETTGIVSASLLARCKPGMLLVNIGRGGLVDQAALLAALIEGRLGGAGLDVTDPEPLPQDDPLWRASNLIVTPHVAGFAKDVSIARVCEVVGANLRRVMAGQAPLSLVTPSQVFIG